MRSAARAILVLVTTLAATVASAAPRFVDSPHLVPLSDEPCDTVLSPSQAQSSLLVQMLNDPSRRVFCVQPGDYRPAGRVRLAISGSPGQPRVLRFNATDGAANAIQRKTFAVFESILLDRVSWWVIHGLTLRPRLPETAAYINVVGGDRNVIDGNLIDGIDHPNEGNTMGVRISGVDGDPATYNTVQRNVIRNGDQSHNASDYWGVLIGAAKAPGEANDGNAVLDNEIYDWGDGVAIGGYTTDCTEPEVQHATLIDGNDIYVTEAKRVDCASGDLDPNGECICAENAVDNKSNPGPDPHDWTRITNNRAWGYRPTSDAATCGGSGSNGQALSCGNACPGHVFVARNIVSDSTIGISIVGPGWVVAGNLLFDIRKTETSGIYRTQALLASHYGTDVRIQWNTIVGTDAGYDDQSSHTDTRCNAVIEDAALPGTAGFRGTHHVTERNFLYDAPQPNFLGNSNESFESAGDSGNSTFCFWRRRWTTPERICVPHAATRDGVSPHANADSSCDTAIGAPFGMAHISYVPEPGAVALALATLASLATLRRARN